MKVSVSLPDEDVEFLDAYARAHAVASRSAVVQRAIRILRLEELPDAYQQAWEEWRTGSDASPWDETTADGL